MISRAKFLSVFVAFLVVLLSTLLFYFCGGSSSSEDVGPATCEEGASCKSNSDCNGGTCSSGKCRCKNTGFCVEDKDCGMGMCCDTLRNQCYVCIKDVEIQDSITDIAQDIIVVDAVNDANVIDAISDISYIDSGVDQITDTGYDAGNPCDNYKCNCGSYCVVNNNMPECRTGCLKTADCCENQYCDTATKTCKTNTLCHTDNECASNPTKKYCDIGDTFECVECTKNEHCDQTHGLFCDIVSKTCQKIQDACNGSCDYSKQFCSTKTNPPSCQPKNPDLCKSCSVIMNNCPSPLECQPIDPTNPFKGGTCGVECYSVEDCFGNPCDTQFHQCICQ